MKNGTIKGKNYLVWEKDSSHITKVNKKKTDKVISNCIKALSYSPYQMNSLHTQ